MIAFAVVAMLLGGCGAQQTFETLADAEVLEVIAPMASLEVEIPEGATVLAMNAQLQGRVYLCPEYVMAVQTFSAGNLDETIRQVSGFHKEDVTLLQTRMENLNRYDWVWTAVEEDGDVICRAAIVDDGAYHYAVSVSAPAENVGQLEQQWEQVFSSIKLNQ